MAHRALSNQSQFTEIGQCLEVGASHVLILLEVSSYQRAWASFGSSGVQCPTLLVIYNHADAVKKYL